MEEKDTESQRGWQLGDFFEALEKDKRTEERKHSADCTSWRHIREKRVRGNERKPEKMMHQIISIKAYFL